MNANTLSTALNQYKPDTRPNASETIAHIKSIKATVMQKTDIEIDCLFLDQFTKTDKTAKCTPRYFAKYKKKNGRLEGIAL